MARLINRWFVVALLIGLAATPAAARDKSRRVEPSINPSEWFVDGDYPADAKRAGQQGRVVVKASVNAQGRVTSCDVTTSSDSASLDALTCRLVIARGRFLPELDRAGNAVPSSYPISTRWVLKGVTPMALVGPWRKAAVLQIDQSGKVASCKDESSGSVPAQDDRSICAMVSNMSANSGIGLRGGTGMPGLVEVTLESSMAFDNQTVPAMVYDGVNRTVLQLQISHFDVEASGQTKNCQVLVQSGTNNPAPCDGPPRAFLPISEPQGVTFKKAVSRSSGG